MSIAFKEWELIIEVKSTMRTVPFSLVDDEKKSGGILEHRMIDFTDIEALGMHTTVTSWTEVRIWSKEYVYILDIINDLDMIDKDRRII